MNLEENSLVLVKRNTILSVFVDIPLCEKRNLRYTLSMNLNEYQAQAKTTAVYTNPEQRLICTILGLSGEAGEVAEKFKKVYRDKGGVISATDRLEIQKELGDVLWYLAVLSDTLGLTLDEVASLNLEKLKARQQRGQLQGNGDNR